MLKVDQDTECIPILPVCLLLLLDCCTRFACKHKGQRLTSKSDMVCNVQGSHLYLDVDSNDAKTQDLYHSCPGIPVRPSNTL